MKVLMLSHSDGGGGAGRASYRLLQALAAQQIDVTMAVDFQNSADPRVHRSKLPLRDLWRRLRITIEEIPAYIARFPEPRLFSPGLVSGISVKQINTSDADVVNLQWVNFGYLSIRTIGRIRKPLTWSMHDMWAFTGGMNYAHDGPDARWRHGFVDPYRLPGSQWWDVDRWVWRRKVRHWKRQITLIASSSWMADLARKSPLTSSWPVHIIPNPVDTDLYSPGSKAQAREQLQVPADVPLVLAFFPANLHDPRKGFDLLTGALEGLAATEVKLDRPVHVAIAGHEPPESGADIAGLPTHWLGYLDDQSAVAAYRSADVVLVPSRTDNSPQTATEALSCGTPVVAFRATGLPDFIEHMITGYLAEPFDTQEFARGIKRILEDPQIQVEFGSRARERAVAEWSYEAVGRAHRELFESVIAVAEDRH